MSKNKLDEFLPDSNSETKETTPLKMARKESDMLLENSPQSVTASHNEPMMDFDNRPAQINAALSFENHNHYHREHGVTGLNNLSNAIYQSSGGASSSETSNILPNIDWYLDGEWLNEVKTFISRSLLGRGDLAEHLESQDDVVIEWEEAYAAELSISGKVPEVASEK